MDLNHTCESNNKILGVGTINRSKGRPSYNPILVEVAYSHESIGFLVNQLLHYMQEDRRADYALGIKIFSNPHEFSFRIILLRRIISYSPEESEESKESDESDSSSSSIECYTDYVSMAHHISKKFENILEKNDMARFNAEIILNNNIGRNDLPFSFPISIRSISEATIELKIEITEENFNNLKRIYFENSLQ